MASTVQEFVILSVWWEDSSCHGKEAFSMSGTRWYFDHESATAHATLSGIYTMLKHEKNSHIRQPPLTGYELSP